jgi:hypothetical protein
MFEQVAIDRITETENLTDNLEDDAAEWLISWGVSQAKTLISGVQSVDDAGDKIDTVMTVMRQINQIAGAPADDATQLASDIEAFAALYSQTFNVIKPLSVDDYQRTAATITGQTPQEIIQQLLTLVNPASESHQAE